MTCLKIQIPFTPPNWNEYINRERSNYHSASTLKRKEKEYMYFFCRGKQWTGTYPVEIAFVAHFKDRRQDVDNTRIKGILDGMVKHGVIKNDNLKHVRRVIIDSIIDGKEGIDIYITEYKETKYEI